MNAKVIGTEELMVKFRVLNEAVQEENLSAATLAGGTVIVGATKENIAAQGLIRTRNLSRSIHEEVLERSSQRVVVGIGTNVDYGPIHEFGGVIQAKRSKYLAIPVNGASGSPAKRSDLHVLKTAGGTLVLVDASGQIQYVLRSSVTIPAQPYLRPALDEHGDEAQEEIGRALAALIEKAAVS